MENEMSGIVANQAAMTTQTQVEKTMETAAKTEATKTEATTTELTAKREADVVKAVLPRGVRASPYALEFSDVVTENDFASACKIISHLANFANESLFWWLGDMINEGERKYRNKYEQWVELTDYSVGYLRNAAWVCAHVPKSIRYRIPTIQHAAVLATLPPERQKEVLDKINDEKLSAAEARRYAKGDPNYRRKALPENGASLPERMRNAFERIWTAHEREWMSAETRKDMARRVWNTAVDLMVNAR